MTYNLWLVVTGRCSSLSLSLLTCAGKSDGQKRTVYIYRFLTTGTIDGKVIPFIRGDCGYIHVDPEKIFQRQVTKLGLSHCRPFTISSSNYRDISLSQLS